MPPSQAVHPIYRIAIFASGMAAYYFSNGVAAFALAAWLAPLLLLRFSRLSPPFFGFVSIAAGTGLAGAFMFAGQIPVPAAELIMTAALSGLITGAIYAADRVLAPRLPALLASLVFPCTVTLVLYGLGLVNPFGTWGHDSYVQYPFGALTQVASVTGLWGVYFLVAWAAAALQPVWASGGRALWTTAAPGVFAAALAGVLVYGVLARPPAGPAIKVAALSNPDGMPDRFFEGCAERTDYACRRDKSRARHDILFALSREAAENGAMLIAWYEAAAQYDEQYESDFIERAKAFARRHGVHLIAGAARIPNDPDALLDNKAFLFTPEGDLALDYFKAIPVPGEQIVEGDRDIKTFEAPFGRIGVMICFDANFPALARQAAQRAVDLLVVPSNDWRAITPLHGHMASFRSIETGSAMVRPASNGLSIVTDATGRVIASRNAFTSDDAVLYADLTPVRRATLYAKTGDALPSAAGLLLFLLTVTAFLRRR